MDSSLDDMKKLLESTQQSAMNTQQTLQQQFMKQQQAAGQAKWSWSGRFLCSLVFSADKFTRNCLALFHKWNGMWKKHDKFVIMQFSTFLF